MKRNPKACLYTSSYDRGLEHLLDIWPAVIKAVPDAKLNIFYGWQTFDAIHADNPERQAYKEKMEKKMRYKGIVHHGRVGHRELEKWFQRCGIYAYPTHFEEISCISAMKAQAFGAIPVVINYAALKETVKFGIKVDGDIYEKETKEKYLKKLIWALKHPEWQEEVRAKMMPWAKKSFAWALIAEKWDKIFRETIKP